MSLGSLNSLNRQWEIDAYVPKSLLKIRCRLLCQLDVAPLSTAIHKYLYKSGLVTKFFPCHFQDGNCAVRGQGGRRGNVADPVNLGHHLYFLYHCSSLSLSKGLTREMRDAFLLRK